jgi:predicted kinase
MILIDGPMGSGKTSVGKILHKKLPRTAMLGMDDIKWCVSDFKRDKEDNRMTSKVVQRMTEEYLKHKINILIPQAFWKKENIDQYIKLAEEAGVKVFIYQMTAPKEVLMERLSKREKPSQAPTPMTQEKIEANYQTWKDNQYGLGKVFDTSKMSSEEIASEILAEMMK